jgi:multiple sugar transport system ATP-binding protein
VSSVTLQHLTKIYSGHAPAVDELNLEIRQGEFFTLLGPSGCGKTTTLRMIAGLETPSDGRVLIGDRDCTSVHPRDRGVGLVFQSYALYPHMTVRQNIMLNLVVSRVAKAEVDRRVRDIATSLKLDHLLDRHPRLLSGGERQRVALGRALVRNPNVLLMDEPLSNLDLKLREHMRIELKRLHNQFRHTVVCVTHDQAEALSMSDRIAVMQAGKLEQVGTPDEVYENPANLFVASFLGSPSINQFPGRIVAEGGKLEAVPLDLPVLAQPIRPSADAFAHDQSIVIGVRPEDILVSGGERPGCAVARVSLVEPLGASKLLSLELAQTDDERRQIMALVPGHERVAEGATVSMALRAGAMLVFDGASQMLVARSMTTSSDPAPKHRPTGE